MATSNDKVEGPKKRSVSLYTKVLEALAGNRSAKGLTMQAIKRYILETYPEMQENFSNKRLQTAVAKGLESTEVIRPKSSAEQQGFKGHFVLNRSLVAKKEKKKISKAGKDQTAEKTRRQKTEKPAETVERTKTGSSKTKTTPIKSPMRPSTSKPLKQKVAKRPLTPTISNASSASTPRVRESTFTVTPKISKADKAGKRSKTTAIKKMLK